MHVRDIARGLSDEITAFTASTGLKPEAIEMAPAWWATLLPAFRMLGTASHVKCEACGQMQATHYNAISGIPVLPNHSRGGTIALISGKVHWVRVIESLNDVGASTDPMRRKVV